MVHEKGNESTIFSEISPEHIKIHVSTEVMIILIKEYKKVSKSSPER